MLDFAQMIARFLSSRIFLVGALILIYTPLAYAALERLIPASRWLEVQEIAVENTAHGRSPRVTVRLSVRRAFAGVRLVSVLRKIASGYQLQCARETNVDYLPDMRPSPDTDLNHWLNVPVNPPCSPLAPGRYVVSVLWTIKVPGIGAKFVRADSNDFEVTP